MRARMIVTVAGLVTAGFLLPLAFHPLGAGRTRPLPVDVRAAEARQDAGDTAGAPAPSDFEGTWLVDGRPGARIEVSRITGDTYRVERPGEWSGVGLYDGETYLGVFRYPANSVDRRAAGKGGTHLAQRLGGGGFVVRGEFTLHAKTVFFNRWVRPQD